MKLKNDALIGNIKEKIKPFSKRLYYDVIYDKVRARDKGLDIMWGSQEFVMN